MNNAERFVVTYNITKNGTFHRSKTITLAVGATPLMWKDAANRNYEGMVTNGLTEDVFEVDIQSVSSTNPHKHEQL